MESLVPIADAETSSIVKNSASSHEYECEAANRLIAQAAHRLDSDLPAAKPQQLDYDGVLVQQAGQVKSGTASAYADVLVVAPAVGAGTQPEDKDYIDVSQSVKTPQSDYSTFKELPLDTNPSAHEYEGMCGGLGAARCLHATPTHVAVDVKRPTDYECKWMSI